MSTAGVVAARLVRGAVVVSPPSGEPFFEDSFADGQKNPANDFVYTDNNGQVQPSSAADLDGNGYGLAITCGPNGAEEFGDQNAIELGYDFGRPLSEFWKQFRMRVPANFTHRNRVGWAENNKLAQWYHNQYGSGAPEQTQQVGFEFWPEAADGTTAPRSYLRTMCRTVGSEEIEYVTDAPGSSNPTLISPDGPLVPGESAIVRIHVRASSAPGVSDGVIEVWVNGVKIEDVHDLPLYNPPNSPYADERAVFRLCKFFGSSNSGYVEETVFAFDDFKFYDTDPGWT